MDPTSDIATAALTLTDEGRDLWDEVLPYLSGALSSDAGPFLDALEAAGRGAGLIHRVPVAEVLDAFTEGGEQIRELLLSVGDAGAESQTLRLLALERAALTVLAAGYAAGLQETIDGLRRLVDEASPLDADSGAMKPAVFGELLSLEVERCQRMDLSLGLAELAVDDRPAPGRGAVTHQVGTCLRESLRRYDSVGLTQDGAFILVLPDVSRRGLAGAAERLRRRLNTCTVQGGAPEVTFALAHYDFVDASATEMLRILDRSLQQALEGGQPLAWA